MKLVKFHPKQLDFLYWHAVSKMRVSEFGSAAALFRLLQTVQPEWHCAGLGLAYSLMRQGQFEQAHATLSELRRRPMRAEVMAMLGRLHRRCEYERKQGMRAHPLHQRIADDAGVTT